MSRLFISSLLFSITATSFAQKAFKFNAHFQYQTIETTNEFYTDGTVLQIEESKLTMTPSPTFSFYTQKGNFHEIGLSHINVNIDNNQTTLISNTIIEGGVTKEFSIAFRYDYNLKLTSSNSVITPYVGLSTSLSYESMVNEPKINSLFKRTTHRINSTIGFVPRIVWHLNETVFLDFNVPINIFQIDYKHLRIHDPSFTFEQQKNGGIETSFFPKNYEVRLGVGILLFKE